MSEYIPPSFKESFGKRIKEARVKNGLSGEQLASLVGCTRQGLNLIENGKTSPSFFRGVLLCQILDIKPDELFSHAKLNKIQQAARLLIEVRGPDEE